MVINHRYHLNVRKFRPVKEKLHNANSLYFVKREYLIFKQGFTTLCKDKTSKKTILQQVKDATNASFYPSRLLNFHLQRIIENSKDIPDILNQTWIRQLFSKQQKDQDSKESMRLSTYSTSSPIQGQVKAITFGTTAICRSNAQ